ncbi:MAG: FmdB family zinc ribbon protein [Ktedonobacterales bacterium]
MPTYEYVCQSCSARFEAWQKITDDPLDVCPTCGQPVRRVIFPVGLVFKGSGFYINDTRSATSTALPEHDGKSGAESKSGEAVSAKPNASQSGAASDSGGTSGSAPASTGTSTSGTSTSGTSGK